MSALATKLEDAPPLGLEELTLELSMARGIDEVMAVVRNYARPLVGADGITFVLRENGMCHYADEDAISPLWKGQRFPLESCISGWAMLNRDTAVIEDIYTDERIPHAAYQPTFVKSLVMVPVRKDDPIGAIGAYWAHKHKASDAEVRALRHIANSAAVAMTNVALISQLIAAKDEAVKAKETIILAMAALAETRDNDTGNHVRRTQHYVRVLAEAALERGLYAEALKGQAIDLLYKSAPLHDIGKVGIPDRILLKPGKLDAEEFAIMKTHAQLGRDAIATAERHLGECLAFFEVAKELALTHHERWDGTGYPQGLAGHNIPLAGRLMAIADTYDALVSERVYKAALPHGRAVEIIVAERGKQFDPALVDVFVEIADDFDNIHRFFADQAN